MTMVNAATVFSRWDFREMVEDLSKTEVEQYKLNYWNEILSKSEFKEGVDYSTIINVNRQRRYMREIQNLNLKNWIKGF